MGSPGKNHDAAVFESSRLPKVLASELFQLEAKDVEGVSVCPVLLGDQAFPLQCHLMKPFSRAGPSGSASQVFNYRLSRARRVAENAFGRLKAHFRIMHKGIEVDIDNINRIIRACCILHNICEELKDQCDITWMEDVVRQDKSRTQPVCRSQRSEPHVVAVPDALAKSFTVGQAS
nr:putative nuclease HARBI1 [Rhipicephalus microplus]